MSLLSLGFCRLVTGSAAGAAPVCKPCASPAGAGDGRGGGGVSCAEFIYHTIMTFYYYIKKCTFCAGLHQNDCNDTGRCNGHAVGRGLRQNNRAFDTRAAETALCVRAASPAITLGIMVRHQPCHVRHLRAALGAGLTEGEHGCGSGLAVGVGGQAAHDGSVGGLCHAHHGITRLSTAMRTATQCGDVLCVCYTRYLWHTTRAFAPASRC